MPSTVDLIAIAGMALSSIAVPSQAPSATVPLTVQTVTDPQTGEETLQVTNEGTTQATAWAVRVVQKNGQIGGVVEDIYTRLASATSGENVLLGPGQAATVNARYPPRTVSSAIPVAVVYEDQTAIGEETTIDDIFRRRLEELPTIEEVLRELRVLQQAGASRGAMQHLADELKRAASEPHGSARGLAASNLNLILSGVVQGRGPGSSLGELIALFQRTLTVTSAHSKRRQ